jgi:NAD(P)-dependent dehydrogenase (short-subunit alcohol dehydrogenase family)
MRTVALVTGASSGIGLAVAHELARTGWSVIMAGRRGSLLEAAARAGGANCVPMTADVTDVDSVNALFVGIRDRFGRLDLLFNNAGISAPAQPLEDLPIEAWRSVIDTNLTGSFLCTQAAVRLMKAQHPSGGRIINNGSISAAVPRPWMIAYTASKHAITGLTKATALEGRQHKIACGQIDIGNAESPLSAELEIQADLSLKPEPVVDVKHVAEAVLYMAGLPLDTNVLSMTVMATAMPFVGRG